MSSLVLPILRRDFLGLLPLELALQILSFLDLRSLGRAASVSKGWGRVVFGEGAEMEIWKKRLVLEGWYDRKEVWRHVKYAEKITLKRLGKSSLTASTSSLLSSSSSVAFSKSSSAAAATHGGASPAESTLESYDILSTSSSTAATNGSVMTTTTPKSVVHMDEDADELVYSPNRQIFHHKTSSDPLKVQFDTLRRAVAPHVFRDLFKRHHRIRLNWFQGKCRSISFAGHGDKVVTCLQFDSEKIVSGSDDQTIHVYDTRTGRLDRKLAGHDGGVWALAYLDNTLVSGSTDRSVRVWDMRRGKCTHKFEGHTSTVRCLMIVTPALNTETGTRKRNPPFISN